MRKLRVPLLLAVLQLSVAVALDVWASRKLPAAGVDTLYAPTGWVLCRGINAPAWLVERILTYPIPISRVDKAPFTILGISLHEYFFMFLVFVLWFAIGAVWGHFWHPNASGEKLHMSSPVVLSMVLFGATLFVLGLFRISKPFDFNNPVGNTLQGALFVLWGLAIALFALLRGKNLRKNESELPPLHGTD